MNEIFITFFRALVFSLLFILVSSPFVGVAQNYQVAFGKNRTTPNHTAWKEYDTKHFKLYWTGDDMALVKSILGYIEQDYVEIQRTLEHRADKKIHIIIHPHLEAFKESNLQHLELSSNNKSGITKPTDYRVGVYYNGNQQDLRRQIRAGIARVYIEKMTLGSSLQEVLQNAVFLELPDWFSLGLAAFVGNKWNIDLDHELKNTFLSKKYKNFEELAYHNPELAGHSMWYYMDSNYGQAVLSNIIYLTRINRSIEGGFLYVLSLSYDDVKTNWQSFFEERYLADNKERTLPLNNKLIKLKTKKINQSAISPNGLQIAYAENNKGKWKVWLKGTKDNFKKLLFKKGFRNYHQETNKNYPLLTWSKQGETLGITYYHKEKLRFSQLNKQGEEINQIEFIPQIQQVHSLTFLNPNQVLISASINGKTDIFIYDLNVNDIVKRVTNDNYDNLHPQEIVLNEQQGFIFSSNRGNALNVEQSNEEILAVTHSFDLYFLAKDSQNAIRITKTPLTNETQPLFLAPNQYVFLSDESGTKNLYKGEIITPLPKAQDTAEMQFNSYPVTNYPSNIEQLSLAAQTQHILTQLTYNDTLSLYYLPLNELQATTLRPTAHRTYILTKNAFFKKIKEQQLEETQEEQAHLQDKKEQNTKANSWTFESDFSSTKETRLQEEKNETDSIDFVFITDYFEENNIVKQDTSKEETKKKNNSNEMIVTHDKDSSITSQDYTFQPSKISKYQPRFKNHLITTQINNGTWAGGIDNYTGDIYKSIPFHLLLKSQMQDVLENYEIEAGIRIPIGLDGWDVSLKIKDQRKRWNKTYSFFRRSRVKSIRSISAIPSIFSDLSERLILAGTPGFSLSYPYRLKDISNILQASLEYPLNIYSRVQGTVAFRMNHIYIAATDIETLNVPNHNSQRLSLGIKYVYDNTQNMDLNLKKGTRLHLYSAVHQRTNFHLLDGKIGFKKGYMTLFGFDARHYLALGKHTVLASRLSGATSLGSEKMLFSFGGVDGEFLAHKNNKINTPSPREYVYQTHVTSMRGFGINTRNGNSYFLGNIELRMPLFKYFQHHSTRSTFLKYFQLVTFFDIGTAWQGSSPFSNDNPLNTNTISPPAGTPQVITVQVNYFRDPLIFAYGAGFRSKLFGYFIRVDYARGIETKQAQAPIWHISIGTDF